MSDRKFGAEILAVSEETVKRHKREKWLKENAKALASSNAYVKASGLPLARHRQF